MMEEFEKLGISLYKEKSKSPLAGSRVCITGKFETNRKDIASYFKPYKDNVKGHSCLEIENMDTQYFIPRNYPLHETYHGYREIDNFYDSDLNQKLDNPVNTVTRTINGVSKTFQTSLSESELNTLDYLLATANRRDLLYRLIYMKY